MLEPLSHQSTDGLVVPIKQSHERVTGSNSEGRLLKYSVKVLCDVVQRWARVSYRLRTEPKQLQLTRVKVSP